MIKVEKPTGGDDARGWGKLMSLDAGPTFNAVNLSKRSVIADLKNPVDVEKVIHLIDSVDVVVQNMRLGTKWSAGANGCASAGSR